MDSLTRHQSGARRTRPRGFIQWTPRRDTAALVAAAQAVLAEYQNYLPLALRQIYYRLVGTSLLGKTERDYKRLCETMNKARRAGLVSFESIRDDGITTTGGGTFRDRQHVFDYLAGFARGVQLDRQLGQPRRLQIWCEAVGMVPQLERVAGPYSIPVLSSGGFDSVTVKHAQAIALGAVPTTVLHIGDHDPSGVHVFSSLMEDLNGFIAGYSNVRHPVEFVRLAVTPEQAAEHALPSAPPKPTDHRSFAGNQTWQAEALPPDVLAEILEAAIRERLGRRAYNRVLRAEQALASELAELLGEMK